MTQEFNRGKWNKFREWARRLIGALQGTRTTIVCQALSWIFLQLGNLFHCSNVYGLTCIMQIIWIYLNILPKRRLRALSIWALCVRPTPTQFLTNSLCTPIDKAPLHSISSWWCSLDSGFSAVIWNVAFSSIENRELGKDCNWWECVDHAPRV